MVTRRVPSRLVVSVVAVLAALAVIGVIALNDRNGTGSAPATAATAGDVGRDKTVGGNAAGDGAVIKESALNRQAAATLAAIRAGGPFDYPRNDGVVYHNFNRKLPAHRDGYYREYTVRTPGAQNRGARRLITGAGGELYYTADHYETFSRVVEDP